MLQSLGNSDDVVFVIDKVLSQITVQQIDPALVVGFFAGHIVSSNLIVDGTTWTPNRCGNVVAWLY